MTQAMNEPQLDSGACPFHAARDVPAVVSPGDVLVFPKHRRAVVQYSAAEAGLPELCLYYGDKEISFDDAELFPFGETLAKQARFTAADAVGWGKGYDWPKI